MVKIHRFAAIAVASAALTFGSLAGGTAQAAGHVSATAHGTPAMPAAVMADTIIRPSAQLCRNQAWTSGNGRAILRMQQDGNFVLYKDGRPVWQAPNAWSRGNCAVFQTDGNFVVYDGAGSPVWASGTWRRGAYLAIQDDGNVVIYNSSGAPVWATNTGD
ncbi:hypothetical protein GCM10009716_12170 [Streptomyces sodiiphilus]|uniref:Bulb-type lectin domain-containing protein n=1 Tax=Streptomyces sodiiphilus TaxID=226217 RepID=A0ABN2NV49_9ACTN